MDDAAFLDWLAKANGYLLPRDLGGGRWGAVMPHFDPSAGIVTGRIGGTGGWDEKWTFPSLRRALLAFIAWDGAGDPPGWIRQQPSHRRVSQSAHEYDADGRPVGAVGVVYIRP